MMSHYQSQLDFLDGVSDLFLDLARNHLAQGQEETAARYVHVASWACSRQNRTLQSPAIESLTRSVAQRALAQEDVAPRVTRTTPGRRRVVHVLSEALRAGGLTAMATRWIDNDSGTSTADVVILASDCEVPETLERAAVRSTGGVHRPPPGLGMVATALWLRNFARTYAHYVVLHVDVSDVICSIAFGRSGGPPVMLVNHTAHTFWTGIGCTDLILNCRASRLEGDWAREFRGCTRYAGLPIPLTVDHEHETRETARAQLVLDQRLPEDAVCLLTVGAKFKYEALDDLDFLGVVSEVLDRRANAFLLVAGFQPDARWIAAAQRSGGRIRVLGTLSQAELANLYRGADIYLDGFPFGTTTALLEAALHCLAPVLPPAACAPPYATDGIAIDDILVRPNAVKAYIDHLVQLIDNPDLRRAVAQRVHDAVLKHHTAEGWIEHLRAAESMLPTEHAVYDVDLPRRTPSAVHDHWCGFTFKWSWPYTEAFDHLLVRALALGLQPRISNTTTDRLCSLLARTSAQPRQIRIVAAVCNLLSAWWPLATRITLLRAASYLSRPGFFPRVAMTLRRVARPNARGGAYDEYRRRSAR